MIDLLFAIAKSLVIQLTSSQRRALDVFVEHLQLRFRKTLILSLAAFACALLFVGGVLWAVMDMTNQYDEWGRILLTGRSFGGAGLALLSLFGFLAAVSPRYWREEPLVEAHQPSLKEIFAQVALEVIREREATREAPAPSKAAS